MEIDPNKIRKVFRTLHLGRHGNAPRNQQMSDRERPLSDYGRAQAASIATQEKHQKFDFVFASPFPRAQETARIVTGQDTIRILECLDMSDNLDDPLNIMFKDLQYAPLGAYFAHKYSDEMKLWAEQALGGILTWFNGTVDGVHVFIGGHAVTHPAIVWKMAQLLDQTTGVEGAKELSEFALNVNQGEAEVMAIELDHNRVNHRLIKP